VFEIEQDCPAMNIALVTVFAGRLCATGHSIAGRDILWAATVHFAKQGDPAWADHAGKKFGSYVHQE
jgi:hypothetical protein